MMLYGQNKGVHLKKRAEARGARENKTSAGTVPREAEANDLCEQESVFKSNITPSERSGKRSAESVAILVTLPRVSSRAVRRRGCETGFSAKPGSPDRLSRDSLGWLGRWQLWWPRRGPLAVVSVGGIFQACHPLSAERPCARHTVRGVGLGQLPLYSLALPCLRGPVRSRGLYLPVGWSPERISYLQYCPAMVT